MILFAEDYARYPTAIPDTQTTNESFLDLAGLLRAMNIKNYFVHLTLLQPQLQGVDPYSKTLTEEQKTMIALECAYNPWYFFREVARVPAQAGVTPNKFRMNRANLALYFSFLNNVDFALIMPRQLGKSLSTDMLMVWLLFFILHNSKINMLTKDNGLRVANVERIKQIINLLPGYLNFNQGDADNQQMITYNSRNNKYLTAVAQSSEAAALNVGRGLTSPIIHIDEGPFIKFIGTIIPALLASGTAAREEAKRNGMPHGNIFTTTAGKKDDRDGKYMHDLIFNGAPWTEEYMDLKNNDEFKHVVWKACRGDPKTKKIIINGTFSHLQVGKDNEWLRDVLANTNAKGDEADRDFFNVWTSGTQRSPLSPRLNNLIKDSEIDPIDIEISNDGYLFRWFIDEEERMERLQNGHFILGMDTSEAVGRDDIGMVLTDIRDMSVVGTANVNETNLLMFVRFVVELMVRYRNVLINIERKSTGILFIDALLLELPKHGIDPFTRIYNTLVERALTDMEANRIIHTPMGNRNTFFYEKLKTSFGFVTTAESRKELYVRILPEAAKRAGGSVHCKYLSDQIRSLVVKNDRIDHSASGHDDLVIAWLLTMWTMTRGKNLQHYGINPNDCLAYAGKDGNVINEDQRIALEEQKILREEIDALKEELAQAMDGYTIAKLERRLEHLVSHLSSVGGETLSFDGLLKEAEQAREENERQMQFDTNYRLAESSNLVFC